MQPMSGLARAATDQRAGQLRGAAQDARRRQMSTPTVEKTVSDEIAAWQQDQNPLHLLKAISALQQMLDMTAAMTEAASNVTMSVVGNTRNWSGPASQAGQSSGGSFAQVAGSTQGTATPEVLARAADVVRSQVRNTFRNVRRATDRAIEILEGAAADAVRHGNYQAQMGAQAAGGFGGRAAGQIPGGHGGMAGGGGQGRVGEPGHAGSQGGFGGRASGSTTGTPRR